jgi:hypothetical protein
MHGTVLYLQRKNIYNTCHAIRYISKQKDLVRWTITFAGRAFQQISLQAKTDMQPRRPAGLFISCMVYVIANGEYAGQITLRNLWK